MSKNVVEEEVKSHGRHCGDALSDDELRPCYREECCQYGEMDNDPYPANGHEQHKAHRQPTADHLVEYELNILERDKRVELALAVLSGTKCVREFLDAQRPWGRCDDIKED